MIIEVVKINKDEYEHIQQLCLATAPVYIPFLSNKIREKIK
jgi:hypothetical protein